MCYDADGNFMGCPAPEFCTAEPPMTFADACMDPANDDFFSQDNEERRFDNLAKED